MARIAAIVRFRGPPISPQMLDSLVHPLSPGAAAGVARGRTGSCGVARMTTDRGAAPGSDKYRLSLRRQRRTWLYTADARLDNRARLVAALGGGAEAESGEICDARIIVLAYLKWGVDCVRHLAGEFAFAIWDDARRNIFCARDALGIKPLFYASASAVFCAASEERQILGQPGFYFSLKESAVAEYLAGYCTQEQASFFEGLNALPAGHILSASAKGVRVERYWYPENLPTLRYRDPHAYAEHFQEIFTDAVSERLRGQDRAAVCVSGGLDSSSVAAVAQTLQAGDRLHGFTRTSEALPECDERYYSRHLSDALGLVVEPIPCERFWLFDDEDAFAPRVDSPFLAYASYERFLHRRCRELGIRVLLTGHGGDSVIAGSGLSYLDQLLSGRLSVFLDIRRHARGSGQSPGSIVGRYLLRSLIPGSFKAWVRARLPWRDPAIPSWLEPAFARRLQIGHCARSMQGTGVRGHGRRHRIAKIRDLGSVSRAILHLDRTAHEYGLEYRHPFLDRRLVEYAVSLPDDQLFRCGETKLVLRAALQGTLPDAIRSRRDKTYPDAFVNHSLREVSADKITEMFTNPVCAARGFVDRAGLQRTWRRFLAGNPAIAGHTLWFPITMESWLRSSPLVCAGDLVSPGAELG